MNENDLISVIVPVYNVEQYVEQCIESVCNQTYKNLEIIIINDGTEDASGDICKKWANKDKRIRYYEQDNKGLGPARNRGLEIAEGEYIIFLDSDDWLDSKMVESMYANIQRDGADICRGTYYRYDEKLHSIESAYAHYCEDVHNVFYYASPIMCGNLYKKTLFIEKDIKMPATKFEDLATFPVLVSLANKICYEVSPLYYYRINTGKSISDNNKKYINDYPKALGHLITEFMRLNLFENNEELLYNIAIFHFLWSLSAHLKNLKKQEYNEIYNTCNDFFSHYFGKRKNPCKGRYWVWGSYNLSRIERYLLFESDDITSKQSTHYEFSSIISLMAEPNINISIKQDNIFRYNMVCKDIEKSLRQRDIQKDDYILVDFLEERYDLIKTGDSYITKSEALEQGDYEIEQMAIIRRETEECTKLWKNSCLRFINLLLENFQKEHIILVEIYLSTSYVSEGLQLEFKDDYIEKMNNLLKGYYSFFKDNMKGIKVIYIPKSIYYTNAKSQLGCFPYYLNPMAYKNVALQILDEIS